MDTEKALMILDEDKVLSVSSKIAIEANSCCYRSDGWEEHIRDYIFDILVDELTGKNNG